MNDTPTPRTDAEIHASDGQWSFQLRDLCRQLERELTEAQSDLEFRRGLYALQSERVDRLERELEQERQDRKQADLDTIRALGERNEARAALMLAAQWGISSDGFSANVSSAIRCWIINGMKGPPPEAPDYYPKSVNYCYDNLEGPGPTEEERRENARAIQALTVPERIALMIGKLSQP